MIFLASAGIFRAVFFVSRERFPLCKYVETVIYMSALQETAGLAVRRFKFPHIGGSKMKEVLMDSERGFHFVRASGNDHLTSYLGPQVLYPRPTAPTYLLIRSTHPLVCTLWEATDCMSHHNTHRHGMASFRRV